MFKKIVILSFLTLQISFLAAQYEEDMRTKDTSLGKKIKVGSNNNNFKIKDKLVFGSGVMFTLRSGAAFAELTPFVGYKLADPVVVGFGAKGSILSVAGGGKPYGVEGAQVFGQVTLAQSVVLYGEYGAINGVYETNSLGTQRKRTWASSPIVGLGYMQGSNMYVMAGYAFSKQYANINPFGNLIYRFVFYF